MGKIGKIGKMDWEAEYIKWMESGLSQGDYCARAGYSRNRSPNNILEKGRKV